MRAWLVTYARYAAVQLAKGVVFSGLVAASLAPGLVILGAQKALGWRPTFAAAAPSPKDYRESLDDIAADARATSDSARWHADAEDLTDQGPGATDRIREARLNAVTLAIAANEAEAAADRAVAEAAGDAYDDEPSPYE
jgi:hypothetical protein